jgi:hypothetical protein
MDALRSSLALGSGPGLLGCLIGLIVWSGAERVPCPPRRTFTYCEHRQADILGLFTIRGDWELFVLGFGALGAIIGFGFVLFRASSK